jgi:hypothetical protein
MNEVPEIPRRIVLEAHQIASKLPVDGSFPSQFTFDPEGSSELPLAAHPHR